MASSRPQRSYYAILSIPSTAHPEAIKRSYRRLARHLLPDHDQYNKNAASWYQKVAIAYTTLIDPNKRRVYDEKFTLEERARAQKEQAEKQAAAAAAPQNRKRTLDDEDAASKSSAKRPRASTDRAAPRSKDTQTTEYIEAEIQSLREQLCVVQKKAQEHELNIPELKAQRYAARFATRSD